MDMVIKVQILDKVVCISHNVITLRKGMSPTIGKIVGKTGLTLVWQPVWEMENSKPCKLNIHTFKVSVSILFDCITY